MVLETPKFSMSNQAGAAQSWTPSAALIPDYSISQNTNKMMVEGAKTVVDIKAKGTEGITNALNSIATRKGEKNMQEIKTQDTMKINDELSTHTIEQDRKRQREEFAIKQEQRNIEKQELTEDAPYFEVLNEALTDPSAMNIDRVNTIIGQKPDILAKAVKAGIVPAGTSIVDFQTRGASNAAAKSSNVHTVPAPTFKAPSY